MIYSNVPCVSTGVTRAHLFVGSSSKLLDAYGAKDGSEDVFLTALQSRVVTRGAPTKQDKIDVETVDEDSPDEADGEKKEDQPPWNGFDDFIITLRDEHGNERLDKDGNPIQVNCKPPIDLLGRVFLTKPDKRGNRHRARIIDTVEEFQEQTDINRNPISTKFRIKLERREGNEAVKDIMV